MDDMVTKNSFQKKVVSIFQQLKHNQPCSASPIIPIYQKGVVIGLLHVVSEKSLKEAALIRKFAAWRRKSNIWFPAQFRVTYAGTKRWGKTQLLDKEDRILFIIENLYREYIGHIGFYRFDFNKRSCEVDNVIRGLSGVPGIMTSAIDALCDWGQDVLGVQAYYLRVVAHNEKAIALYKRCKFIEIERIPLKKFVGKNSISWEDLSNTESVQAKRFDLLMKKI